MLPERLPSLILLVGCWVPPAVVGLAAADLLHRRTPRPRPAVTNTMLTLFALGWSAVWFLFQLNRIPPYVPGATLDPTYAPPEAVAALALVAGGIVLPGSVIFGIVAFRRRADWLRQRPAPLDGSN